MIVLDESTRQTVKAGVDVAIHYPERSVGWGGFLEDGLLCKEILPGFTAIVVTAYKNRIAVLGPEIQDEQVVVLKAGAELKIKCPPLASVVFEHEGVIFGVEVGNGRTVLVPTGRIVARFNMPGMEAVVLEVDLVPGELQVLRFGE